MKGCKKWSDERKEQWRKAIMEWRPWEKCRGPKTKQGKQKSRLNAVKHGERSKILKAEKKRENSIKASGPFSYINKGTVFCEICGERFSYVYGPKAIFFYMPANGWVSCYGRKCRAINANFPKLANLTPEKKLLLILNEVIQYESKKFNSSKNGKNRSKVIERFKRDFVRHT